MLRLRAAAASAALLLSAGVLHAQTDYWIGDFPDESVSSGTNWVGGTLPVNLDAGTDTLQFQNSAGVQMNLNLAASFLGIVVTDPDNSNGNIYISGGQMLTLGTGGISLEPQGDGALTLTLNVPVQLAGNQTWSGGDITVNSAVTGPGNLVLGGGGGSTYTFNNPGSTMSGSVTVDSYATLLLGASGTPAGSGPVLLNDAASLFMTEGSSFTIPNPVTIGDGSTGGAVNLGSSNSGLSATFTTLTLTGNVTLVPFGDTQYLDLQPSSEVVFAGGVNASISEVLNLEGASQGASLVVFKGSIGNIGSLFLGGSAGVIFDGASTAQFTGIGSISGNTGSEGEFGGTYFGFGKNYAGSMSTVLSSVTFGNHQNFVGTLGFDTTSGATANFADTIDLTNFSNSGFTGLGSATTAILSGPIIPVGGLEGPSAATYAFGGGGGTLTVTGALVDGEDDGPISNGLVMSPGNAPLTLILSGTTSYSGPTYVDGGVLIFNSPISTSTIFEGEESSVGGYTGSTLATQFTDANPQQFINLFDGTGNGVIGFDSLSATRTVTGPIDMTEDPNYFLGTATNVTFTGSILPGANGYQFAGVKGGIVTVDSLLSGSANLTIGLATPLESFGSVSTVILPNANTFTGQTVLQSGYLQVGNAGSIGAGQLGITGPNDDGTGTIVGLEPYGANIILTNSITVPFEGAHFNYAGSPYTLTLNGTITDTEDAGKVIIDGPTVLGGVGSSYDGGTVVNGTSLTVTTDGGIAFGGLTAKPGSTLTFTSPSPGLASNSGSVTLDDSTLTFTTGGGYPSITNLLMEAGSTITFAANSNPTIFFMESDAVGSGNVINLGTGTALEFNSFEDPDYHGTITGGGSIEVDGGSLNLHGVNTYTGGTTVDTFSTLIASNNSAFGSGPVTVYGTLGVNTGVTLVNALTVEDGAAIAGYGTLSPGGTVAIQNGTTIIPGVANAGVGSTLLPPAGTLTFGGGTSLIFGPSGAYNFALVDATGAPGTGFSTVNVSGGLSITANAEETFTINIYSFAANNNTIGANAAANFLSTSGYSWNLVTATGGITGFNPSFFSVSTTNLVNSTGSGVFSVSESGDNLVLNFSPVPEPSTVALMAAGVAAVGAVLLRRRRVRA